MFARPWGESVCDGNWGTVVVIEHTLPDGDKVCTVYGHVDIGIDEDTNVTIGQPIGSVGDFYCPEGWVDHLHFGVYNGAFGASIGSYPSWLCGYLPPESFPGDYLPPDVFVEEHQDPVGLGATHPELFRAAFQRMNGADNGWVPRGPVFQEAVFGEMQEFDTDNVGEAVISWLYDADMAYATYGAIYQKYGDMGRGWSVLGFPISDEGNTVPSPYGATGRYSRFENGTINFINDSGNVYEVHGDNFDFFEQHGYSGWHGFPTSDVYVWNGGWRTDVEEGGFIFTDPSFETYYVSPTAPSALEVTRSSPFEVVLSWIERSAVETGLLLEKLFFDRGTGRIVRIETELAGGRRDGIGLPPNTTSYDDLDVTPGSIYTYSVKAMYDDAPSPSSNEVIVNLSEGYYPFVDDMEDPGSGNWLADAPWGLITSDYHSSTRSWTDSPVGYYANDADVSLATSFSGDLTAAVAPVLRFWHHYDMEPGYDFGRVEVSTNGGVDWVEVAAYSGTETEPALLSKRGIPKEVAVESQSSGGERVGLYDSWVMEQIDLSAYLGAPALQIRFRLDSDGTVTRDGWYIDDVALADSPVAVTLQSISNPASSSLDLSWSESTDPNFSRYEIYRSQDGTPDFGDDLVGVVVNPTITVFQDTGLAPKSTYRYRVYVVNGYGIYAGSNVEQGTTLDGLEYPFADNMEGGPKWFSSTPNTWTLVTPDEAHSGNKIWTDSPGRDYGNNADTSLELAGTLPLTDASALVFWHRLDVAAGDSALVEMSADGGVTWQRKKSFAGIIVSSWTRVQVDVSDVQSDAAVRFRLKTDGSGVADGWDIDDVTVSDAPEPLVLENPVASPGGGELAPEWSVTSSPFFGEYRLYRSTSPNVDLTSALVFTTSYPLLTTFTDTSVTPGQTYYYRVYEVSQYDVYVASNVASGVPTGGSYPFYDEMEVSNGGWIAESPWGRTSEYAYSGSYSWTDSPGVSYLSNANVSLKLEVPLTTAIEPYLVFWERHSLGSSSHGLVEVSTNGTSWTVVADLVGYSPEWEEVRIDLSPYCYETSFWLRFRLRAGGTVGEGWYIDDVSICENEIGGFAYPFYESADDTTALDRWLAGSWELDDSGYLGNGSWVGSAYTYDNNWSMSDLSLAGPIDLTEAESPALVFWHKKGSVWQSYGTAMELDVKPEGGDWTQEWSSADPPSEWSRVQVDLSEYCGSEVRVRFRMAAWVVGYGPGRGICHVDEISVAEPSAYPEVNVDPGVLYFNVHPDSLQSATLSVGNDGTSTLVFAVHEASGGREGASEGPRTDISWLSVTPSGGTVPVGGSLDLTVTCDGSVGAGQYGAYLVVTSNDPVNDYIVVPVHVTVSGIYLLGPAPGDSLEVGSDYDIEWSASEQVSSINIALSTDGGRHFSHNIVTGYSGSSPYPWTVSGTPSDSCVVRIQGVVAPGDTLLDTSDGCFVLCGGTGVPDEPEDYQSASALRLYPSSPNPSCSETALHYEIPESAPVKLTIYNAAGRLVRVLVDDVQQPRSGGYSVSWDGRDAAGEAVASGVYLCTLSAGGERATTKVVLLR